MSDCRKVHQLLNLLRSPLNNYLPRKRSKQWCLLPLLSPTPSPFPLHLCWAVVRCEVCHSHTGDMCTYTTYSPYLLLLGWCMGRNKFWGTSGWLFQYKTALCWRFISCLPLSVLILSDHLTCLWICSNCTHFSLDAEVPPGEESLAKFTEDLQKFTQYLSFREFSGLAYSDHTASCCIVSSIEFDRDGEFFAVAGVTKKIKVGYNISGCTWTNWLPASSTPFQVFEYRSVVRNIGFTNHFPVHEMTCGAKLRFSGNTPSFLPHLTFLPSYSCVAYNPYHKHSLVSSDYEGCVCVWDTNIGRRVTLHQVSSGQLSHCSLPNYSISPSSRSMVGGCGLWPIIPWSLPSLPLEVMTAQ